MKDKKFKIKNILNTEKRSQEEKELEKAELLNEFQMEELEQRFEMRVTWFAKDLPQTPGSSQGGMTFS